MTSDRDGWLGEWAETRIWPSDREKFLDWYDHQPDSWFPNPDRFGDRGWGAFAEYQRTRNEQERG